MMNLNLATHVASEILLLAEDHVIGVKLAIERRESFLRSGLVGLEALHPIRRKGSELDSVFCFDIGGRTYGLNIFSAKAMVAKWSKFAVSTLIACS